MNRQQIICLTSSVINESICRILFSELTHAWEEATELAPNSTCRRVTIRSGVVLGRYTGMIQKVIMPFFLGLGGPIGSGNQIMPWIHISDLVDLFIFAIEEEQVKGILNGVSPQVFQNYIYLNYLL